MYNLVGLRVPIMIGFQAFAWNFRSSKYKSFERFTMNTYFLAFKITCVGWMPVFVHVFECFSPTHDKVGEMSAMSIFVYLELNLEISKDFIDPMPRTLKPILKPFPLFLFQRSYTEHNLNWSVYGR